MSGSEGRLAERLDPSAACKTGARGAIGSTGTLASDAGSAQASAESAALNPVHRRKNCEPAFALAQAIANDYER